MNSQGVPSKPSQDEVNEWINALFLPVLEAKQKEQYSNAITAFENLTYYFIQTLCPPKIFKDVTKSVRFDYVGLMSMLKRFQRDAFGVSAFCAFADELVTAKRLQKDLRDEIVNRVCSLGLRITAEEPRKTRIAAALSLWMCVFRPVTFDSKSVPMNPEKLEQFCASLNLWLATTYLKKFGDISFGRTPKDSMTRLERIKHDFGYRHVTLSTLETLYGSIFQCRAEEKEK